MIKISKADLTSRVNLANIYLMGSKPNLSFKLYYAYNKVGLHLIDITTNQVIKQLLAPIYTKKDLYNMLSFYIDLDLSLQNKGGF
jgi:hypothetical protein